MSDIPERPASEAGARGPVLACVGAFAVILLFKGLVPPDSDTPWHLAQGRILLRRWADGHLGLHAGDAFSWTARDVPWQSNAFAFDALLAACYDIAGWIGVVVLRAALLAALVALAWAVTRHGGAGRWARAGAVWASVVFVIPLSAMRPQLVTFVLLLVCLELTGRALDRKGWPSPVLVLLALAVAVSAWAFLHGAVIAGVVAVVAACVGDVLDRRSWRWPAATATVAVVASCLSPRGIGVWTYALRTSGESAQEGIQEWQPPSLGRVDDLLAMAFLLIVVAFALRSHVLATSRFRWRLLAPGLVLTVLAFQAVRNHPLALLALLPFTARMLGAAGAWLGGREGAPRLHPGRALGAMTIGALLGGVVQTGSLPVEPNPLRSPKFPGAAAAALPGGCRLLNEYNDGGYLIFVRPDVPVSQDGRNDLYGPRRLQEQEDLLNERDPERAAASLRRLGVTCVMLRTDRGLAQALAGDPAHEWRRIGGDGSVDAWSRWP
ncbi:MAG: hypothetical protein ACR2KK_21200 [Acidimicrobiales bacterium]